jgi:hypothetical protein
MQTLIQIQDEAIRRLSVTRTSERRYAKLQSSVYRWYEKQVAKLGIVNTYPHYRARVTWQDVLDIAKLNASAE